MKVAVVVEGDGELRAVPALVAKAGLALDTLMFAPRPIKAGNHIRLARPGELERFCVLAASQTDVQCVIVILDVDDDCAVELRSRFDARVKPIEERFGVPIRVCFCVREYECWFLECADQLADATPEFGWNDVLPVNDAPAIRGAKERLQSCFRKHNKPVNDQARLTQAMDLTRLYRSNRSFRRFMKALSGFDYSDLDAHFAG